MAAILGQQQCVNGLTDTRWANICALSNTAPSWNELKTHTKYDKNKTRLPTSCPYKEYLVEKDYTKDQTFHTLQWSVLPGSAQCNLDTWPWTAWTQAQLSSPGWNLRARTSQWNKISLQWKSLSLEICFFTLKRVPVLLPGDWPAKQHQHGVTCTGMGVVHHPQVPNAGTLHEMYLRSLGFINHLALRSHHSMRHCNSLSWPHEHRSLSTGTGLPTVGERCRSHWKLMWSC